MINIKDTFSKVYIQAYPLVLASWRSHPKKADYQRVVRLAWMEFGLNSCFQLDHESVFFDNTHAYPFPTPFCLWLIGMGNHIIYTPRGKPFKQGAVERSHQTLDCQVCTGQSYPNHTALFAKCQARRQRLNLHLPCRTLGNRAPLQALPQAKHSGKYYHPVMEHRLFQLDRIYRYLAKCKPWYRKVTSNRTIALGAKQYFLAQAKAGTELAIHFDLATKQFIFRNEHQCTIARLKPKGLRFKDLAGDIQGFRQWIKNQNSIVIAQQKT
jgi:hypothetical protein